MTHAFFSFRAMRPLAIAAAIMASLVAAPAMAACFADYKAKMDNPLRRHYGVAEIDAAACSADAAFAALAPRVAQEGWELLEIMSVFDESGLDARRPDAGQFFLRY